MAFFDLSQGFWFGIGFGPILVFCWFLGKLVDFAFLGNLKSTSDEREQAAYERGFEDGLKEEIINRASQRLDESIAEKISSLSVRGKFLSVDSLPARSGTHVRGDEESSRPE